RPPGRAEADSYLSPGRAERQSRRRTRRRVRSTPRLVLSERAPDARADRQRLRRQLRVGDEHARAAHGRTDAARDDAMAVARPAGVDGRQRCGRAIVQRAEKEVGGSPVPPLTTWTDDLD